MTFIKEQTSVYKTALSDLQGAWENLRAAAVENHPFPDSDRLIFQIDEAMSWETVRNLASMKDILPVIHNIAQQAKAPEEVLEGIEAVRIAMDIDRGLTKLPLNIKKLLFLLIKDLKSDGPIQKGWHNFSPLGEDRYHCHLTYRYVACWTCRKGEIEIEVYYVGSREKAPY